VSDAADPAAEFDRAYVAFSIPHGVVIVTSRHDVALSVASLPTTSARLLDEQADTQSAREADAMILRIAILHIM
jgi:hypothetical protein